MPQSTAAMTEKPLSVLYSIAEHYYHDAFDFAARFDVLWKIETHKTGQIKAFVDLLMACECALKSHAILGNFDADPKQVYCDIRKAGHSIERLADLACFLSDRSNYDFLKERLQPFSVIIRYSLEAYDTFFPAFVEWDNAEIHYSGTIGNTQWCFAVRKCLQSLLESLTDKFSGLATPDIGAIFEHERQMKEFIEAIKK
ncbi:hypothetical protein SCD_n00743 [Sulfuricella denitrificans skB26]|uniref:HEPN domain-containing protein n=2 Tax=Sulfuricella denitrificans TaxID=649841 RepID=S6A9R8_SULDS|nr:hypothetical protein SCD_n00743 [Sulfuricella denitrificans skB26]